MNRELLQLGLRSSEMYADSSLVKANVNTHELSRSGLAVSEFQDRSVEGDGLFVLRETGVDDDGTGR